MNKDAQYWLTRVAVKLYEKHIQGFDFTIEHYWEFDWDDSIALEDNLRNVAAEDNAMTTLTTEGVIRSEHRENFFRSQQLESFDDPARGFIIWGGWHDFDPARREYGHLRIIEDFNWSGFLEFCKEHHLDYKEAGILATLELANQTPVVRIGDETYILRTLQSGTTLDIIEAAYDHIDTRFGFAQLRLWTNKLFAEQNRFTDIFRKGKNPFSGGGPLGPFADITAQSFMLRKQAHLSQKALEAIDKSRTN